MKLIRYLLVGMLLVALFGTAREIPAVRAEGEPRSASAVSFPNLEYVLKYQWHTFYGVNGSVGQLSAVATDASGNVYVAGYLSKTWGSPLHAYSGGYDIIVMKLNSRGQYQWHTFYGAAPVIGEDGDDEAAGIAVDGDGNVYVTGYSDRTWKGPGSVNPLNPHGGDAEYMFVLKLTTNGAYLWHTFFQAGRGTGIALDSSRNVYVTGDSALEWGSPKHSGGELCVTKLNASGAHQWHTYYGAGASSMDEIPRGIAVDASGYVYVAGQSPDTWRGDGNAVPLHAFSGGAGYSADIVVLKLNSSGTYQWHTFWGASEYDDIAYAIAVDKNGNPYIAGGSYETWGSPLHAFASNEDIVVLKLNASGARLWHTFWGSGYSDGGTGIAVDRSGNAYVTGWSAGSWLGTGNASPKHPHSANGNSDVTVLKLNSSGAYAKHTFYGADSSQQSPGGIALGPYNNVFTTGLSQASWKGDGNANPLHAHSGNLNGDGFVLKLSDWLHKDYLPVVMGQ